jgi:phosphoribosylformylglycinamidine synthase
VEDVRRTVTPQLATEDNALLLIDLGKGNNALGATALAQVYRQLGDAGRRARCRAAERLLGRDAGAGGEGVSAGTTGLTGLLVTLAEMAFTGHCGVKVDIAALGEDRLAALFNEELAG